ncbi:MAG: zinc ribbon domain-containing protein, partial [Bradyrhizobium sp.]
MPASFGLAHLPSSDGIESHVLTAPAQTCTNCRTPLPEGALFCLHCGTATPTDAGVLPPTGATEVPEVGKLRR